MPTIAFILTFISMINTTSERLKASNFFICLYFSFYEQLKFRGQLSWPWKKFYNLGAWLHYFDCVLAVMWMSVFCISFSQFHVLVFGMVCDCGISWPYSLVKCSLHTHYLLVMIAVNFCEHQAQLKHRAWSGSKLIDTLMVYCVFPK